MLGNYAQSSRISSAITYLYYMSQGPMETKRVLATMFNTEIYRCGNVHSPGEVLTLLIDALYPTICSLLAHYKKSHCSDIYLDVDNFVQHKVDAVCA